MELITLPDGSCILSFPNGRLIDISPDQLGEAKALVDFYQDPTSEEKFKAAISYVKHPNGSKN